MVIELHGVVGGKGCYQVCRHRPEGPCSSLAISSALPSIGLRSLAPVCRSRIQPFGEFHSCHSSHRTRVRNRTEATRGRRSPSVPERKRRGAICPHRIFPLLDSRCSRVTGYQVVEFGPSHAIVIETIHRVASFAGIRVVGFSDMSVEEVAAECGVSLLQARLAKMRE